MGPRLRGDDSLREAELYYVYFLASRRYGTIYIGVTNNLGKRLAEHRAGKGSKFVREYGVLRLVYVESFQRPDEAIAREKQFEEMESGLEDQAYRNRQPGMARPLRSHSLTAGRSAHPRRPRADGDP
jgi:putative endonuclease